MNFKSHWNLETWKILLRARGMLVLLFRNSRPNQQVGDFLLCGVELTPTVLVKFCNSDEGSCLRQVRSRASALGAIGKVIFHKSFDVLAIKDTFLLWLISSIAFHTSLKLILSFQFSDTNHFICNLANCNSSNLFRNEDQNVLSVLTKISF